MLIRDGLSSPLKGGLTPRFALVSAQAEFECGAGKETFGVFVYRLGQRRQFDVEKRKTPEQGSERTIGERRFINHEKRIKLEDRRNHCDVFSYLLSRLSRCLRVTLLFIVELLIPVTNQTIHVHLDARTRH